LTFPIDLGRGQSVRSNTSNDFKLGLLKENYKYRTY